MLFNSYAFIFLFLPLSLFVYWKLSKYSSNYAIGWLTIASIFFYGYWSIQSLPILLISITTNYYSSKIISDIKNKKRKIILLISIFANISLLFYFKYINFIIDNYNIISILLKINSLGELNTYLPIGISFYTFTQIAFLIDSYRGLVGKTKLTDYILFVTYFPHLIAGPIIHHRQVMPQFQKSTEQGIDTQQIILGSCIFILGLTKKLILADQLGQYVNAFYANAAAGANTSPLTAWLASFAYTFQLYFDFSGYSDMAVGISMFFGVLLPVNFNSPLRSPNIILFWQRWHMSLTKYIGDYLYTPVTLHFMRLAQGKSKTIEIFYTLVIPTFLIFVILGLWHGANWTYILFGSMHGCFLIINHLWRIFCKNHHWKLGSTIFVRIIFWIITFSAVNLSFVMFRSDSIGTAIHIYRSMLHIEQATAGVSAFAMESPWTLSAALIASCAIILTPLSTTTLLHRPQSTLRTLLLDSVFGPVFLGICFSICILLLGKTSPFLYFAF